MPFQILRCYILIFVCAAVVTLAALMLIFDTWLPKIRAIALKRERLFVRLIILAGFAVYLVSIIGYMGVEKFVKDFDVFLMWSKQMLDGGLRGFMTEYPPFGLYILAGLQLFLRLFGLGDHYLAASLLMKLPSILATLAIAYLAYVWAKKEHDGIKPLFIMTVLAFNPAFLINASMWGQIDMMMILLAVLAFYFLKQKKLVFAALFYTAGCLVKAQMIFLAPVFGIFMILPLFGSAEGKQRAKGLVIGVLASVAMFFISAFPFKQSFFEMWLINFFKHITNEHPVNTASAFNLFGLHGGNAIPDTNSFLFLNYRIWGYIFIGAVCLLCAFLCIKNKEGRNVFLMGAFCVAAVFVLGVSMHERYILPALAFMAIASVYIQGKKPIIFTLAYTFLSVINQSIILFDLFGGKTWTFKLFSGISTAIFILFAVYVVSYVLKEQKITKAELNEGNT